MMKKNDEFIVNDMAAKVVLYNYRLMNSIYRSQKDLVAEYERAGILHSKSGMGATRRQLYKACL